MMVLTKIRSNNKHLSGILQKMLQEKIQLYVSLFGVLWNHHGVVG